MVPDADQVKQILAGIAGQIDEQNSLPPLLSLSVRPSLARPLFQRVGLDSLSHLRGLFCSSHGCTLIPLTHGRMMSHHAANCRLVLQPR